MWISNFAVKNPVVTTVVMLALVVFGLLALVLLQTDEFPEVNPPIVTVTVPYPGASPENVEREIIDRLEEAISSISGVKKMDSTATDGFAAITVEFIFEKDLQEATQDIRDKISEIRQELPQEMEEPVLTRFDPNDLPIISLILTSPTLTQAQLTQLADPRITGAIKGIPGVAEADVVGGVEPELTVELHPPALQAAQVGVAQVVQALQAQNLAAPVGRVNDQYNERSIRLRGRLQNPSDFEQIVIASRNGQVVRLGDIATVRAGNEEPRSVALFNGSPAVGIDVIKATNASTTAVAQQVRERVHKLQESLPEDVQLRIVRDSGVRVEQSVNDVKSSLLEGAFLTVLVVFVFLNSWRSTVITGLALPVSVIASFVAVWGFGFTLNTMSLLGLSLAIGILIDDAIVVRENIVRHMEMGKDHVRAAKEGTAEIGLAVAATTFSIVVVFVPVAFMGGLAEQWFAPFALTIACSVLVSLLVSFSLDPMLSAMWPDPAVQGGKRSWLTRRLAKFNGWLDRRTDDYKRVIGWALRHRLATTVIALGTFALALAMPALGWVGSEFFPLQDRSEFSVRIETPPGSNLQYTEAKTTQADRIARSMKEVAYTYVTVGGLNETVDEATIYVRLVPKSERKRSQEDVSRLLREQASRIAGAKVSLLTGGFGPQEQIQIQVTGPENTQLNALAEAIAKRVEKVPGAVDVGLSSKGQKPEFEVSLDRDLAGTLGVTVGQVAQSLRPAFAGIDAGDWVDPTGETRDVYVRFSPEARTNQADLERLPLIISTGDAATMVPLGQVARIEKSLGPGQITHLNRQRVVRVHANTQDRPLNQVVQDINAAIASMHIPSDYEVTQGGQSEDQQEVFGRIFVALTVAVMLMYMILVIQFRSFTDPIPIMASLPLSLIGVMLALLVTGSTLNLMSMIGVILLIGIVAKNAILLIDFAKWSEERGMSRREAIIEAGGVRLRPILMTSLAIVAGMLPVAIGAGEGADFRAPLGRAVIGGVITSTLLTLLAIPTFYDISAGLRDRALRRAKLMLRSSSSHEAPAAGE